MHKNSFGFPVAMVRHPTARKGESPPLEMRVQVVDKADFRAHKIEAGIVLKCIFQKVDSWMMVVSGEFKSSVRGSAIRRASRILYRKVKSHHMIS